MLSAFGQTNRGSAAAAFGGTGVCAGVTHGYGNADDWSVEGFAKWREPGRRMEYSGAGSGAGALIFGKFEIDSLPHRVWVDGMNEGLSASSNRMDPKGLDETAKSVLRWSVTAHGARSACRTPRRCAPLAGQRSQVRRRRDQRGIQHRHAAACGRPPILPPPLRTNRIGGWKFSGKGYVTGYT